MVASGCELQPLTLCAGVGSVAVLAAADEAESPVIGSDEVAGEKLQGLCGVWGWKDMMGTPRADVT